MRNRTTTTAVKGLLVALILIVSLAGTTARAANHFVRAGASGSGADWTNAMANLPSSLTRGDTYFVAGGSYGSYSFDDAASGTTRISVVKATAANHGTDTGWDPTYGTTQAVFTAFVFSSSYVTLDGQYEYGFKVNRTGQGRAIDFTAVQQVELKYIDISGPGPNFIYTDDGRGINMGNNGSINGLLVSHVAIHGFETLISSFNASNVIWEYMKMYDNAAGNPDFRHPNVLQAGGNNNIIFRFNDITRWATEGIMLCPSGACTSSNWYIYGNVWHDSKSTGPYARVLESQYGAAGPIFLFNNDFVNTWIPINLANGGSWAAGSIGRNNIYWGNDGGGPSMPSESNNLSGSSTTNTPFVNYTNKDYRITPTSAAVGAGANLTSYCSGGAGAALCQDAAGVPRPASGNWDIGAYQGRAVPAPPTNVQITSVQ